MSETEIDLARHYLAESGHDAVAALIRSVRDLARARRLLAVPNVVELRPVRLRDRPVDTVRAVELA